MEIFFESLLEVEVICCIGLKQNFGCIEEVFSIVLKNMVYLVQIV